MKTEKQRLNLFDELGHQFKIDLEILNRRRF